MEVAPGAEVISNHPMDIIKLNLLLPVPSNPIVFILGVVFVVDIVFAWRVWISNRKNLINIYYALTVLMAGLWTLGLLM